MRKSQELMLERIRVQGELNRSPEVREGEEGAEEARNKIEALQTELAGLDTSYRDAVLSEEQADMEAREARNDDGLADWQKELRRIAKDVTLGDFVHSIMNETELDSRAKEYRSHVFGDDARADVFPMEFLLVGETDDREQRTAGATTAGRGPANQMPIAARVFARGDAEYLGAQMPPAGVGEMAFPVITAGPNPSGAAEGVRVAAAPATITITRLEPKRLPVTYKWGMESSLKMEGLPAAIATDGRMALRDAYDQAVINQFYADLDDPAAPGADIASGLEYLAIVASLVDGKLAYTVEDVRFLVGTDTYVKAASTLIGANSDTVVTDKLPASRFRASSRVPAAAGANRIQQNIGFRAMGMGRMQAPVWRGVQMIRDNVTLADSGETQLTLAMYYNTEMIRTDAHVQTAFRLGA